MATTIEELVVKMDMDSAKYRAELDKVTKSLDKLGEKIDKAGDKAQRAFQLQVATYAVQAAKALFGFVEAGAAAGAQMEMLAQKTGISVEALNKQAYAAGIVGISVDTMGKGMAKLAKTMESAAGGNKEAQAVFKALGISATDSTGKLRPMGDMMDIIRTKFREYADGAGKSAIAQKLFGRGGAELIPDLNLSAQAIARLAKEQTDLGLNSAEASKAGLAFEQDLRRVQAAGTALSQVLVVALEPALRGVTNAFVNSSKKGEDLREVVNDIMAPVRGFGALTVHVFGGLILLMKQLASEAAVTGTAIKTFMSGSILHMVKAYKDAYAEAKQVQDEGDKDILATARTMQEMLDAINGKVSKPKDEGFVGPPAPPPIIPGDNKTALSARQHVYDALLKMRVEYIAKSKALPLDVIDIPDIDESKLKKFLNSKTEIARQLAEKFAEIDKKAEEVNANVDFGGLEKKMKVAGIETEDLKNKFRDLAKMTADLDKQHSVKEIVIKNDERNTKLLEEYKNKLQELTPQTEKARIEQSLLNGELHQVSIILGLTGGNTAEFAAKQITMAENVDRTKKAIDDLIHSQQHQLELQDAANRIMEESQSDLDRLYDKIELLRETYAAGLLPKNLMVKGIAEAEAEFIGLAEIGMNTKNLLSDAFAEFFINFDQGIGKIAASFIKAMEMMIAKVIAAKLIGGIFSLIGGAIGAVGGGGGGAVAGAAAGGALSGILLGGNKLEMDSSLLNGHADGGPVSANQSYLVGEKGPEMFVPDVSGHIMSNADTKSASTTQRVEHIHRFDDSDQRLTLREWWEGWMTDAQARAVI